MKQSTPNYPQIYSSSIYSLRTNQCHSFWREQICSQQMIQHGYSPTLTEIWMLISMANFYSSSNPKWGYLWKYRQLFIKEVTTCLSSLFLIGMSYRSWSSCKLFLLNLTPAVCRLSALNNEQVILRLIGGSLLAPSCRRRLRIMAICVWPARWNSSDR